MSIRFVLGRAGSGKTSRCLDEVRANLQEQPVGHPLVLLVPEQATFQAEYALVASPQLGGMVRAQALSFRRLAWRVMQEAGGTARLPIDENGKKLLLHKIIHKRKETLKLFHASSDKMGFIDKVNELLTELKRYCISPDMLERHTYESVTSGSGLFPLKLHDLQLVYRELEQELSRLYLDGEDVLSLLAQQMGSSAFVADAEIWVDGFHGFTPQEFAVLEQLMVHARHVTITLCLNREYTADEQPHELELFHPTARTMSTLQLLAETNGVECLDTVVLDSPSRGRFAGSAMLAYLEDSFDRRIKRPFQPKALETAEGAGQHGSRSGKVVPISQLRRDITLSAAANRRAEAETAAREMIRLARDEGMRWRDMTVLVRNFEQYGDMLAMALTDYGIPFFMDQKRTVMHHPLVEMIRSALDVVRHNWPYDAVFRCVKTDFFLPFGDDPDYRRLTRSEMDKLENYVLALGIQGSRWTDGKPWTYIPRSSLEETEARSITDAEARLLQTVNECRSKIAEPLHAFARKLGRSKTVMPMVEALYELLVTLRVPERLEQWSQAALRSGAPGTAKEHAGVWDRVIDMLDQLVEMMGEEPISMELFTGLIETGLESIRLGLVPPAVDQVLVGSMDRTRTDGVKRLFLLGVSEGVIPSKLNEDGLLTEAEREKLAQSGLRLAESSRRRLLDEQFLIYNALCTPSEHLWLSYPLADEEGKSLLPSDLIRQVKQLFPSVKEAAAWVEPPADDNAIQLSFLAQPDRALTHLAVQLKQAANGAAVAPIWWDVYNWFARTDREKLRPLLQSLHYTNREQPLHPPTSRELYGSHLKTSVSRMERFVACPFSQFISHGLRLDERRVYRLEAPDIGQLFHAALSQFADRLAEEQLDWGSLTPEHCAERASQVVDELAPRLQSEILLSSKRYHYIAGKLKATISRAASVLGEHSRRSTFAPVGTEVGFGPEQQLPALQYKLQGGATMEVIGRIDRVDRTVTDRGTLLRVIDYKSSQTSLQLASVYHGLSLQMLTYLDVVLTYAEHWIGTEALPAGVLYFHVHNPIIQRKNAVPPEKARAELNKRYKMKGLLLADEETVRRMDSGLEGRSGYSELVPAALKADGGFYKTSSVATEPQWNALRRYVRKAISSIGSEIAAGNVDIAPYRMGKKAACTMCSYRPVCQFDPLVEGNDYRQLPQLGKDFVWELIERSASEEEFKR